MTAQAYRSHVFCILSTARASRQFPLSCGVSLLICCSMALDQQRNWTISMAENLDKILRSSGNESKTNQKDAQRNAETDPTLRAKIPCQEPVSWKNPPIHLPEEIIIQILEYVSRFRQAQYTLASCCRLSFQWYSAAVPLLYERPYLYGKNFDPFVRTITPSKNLHVRHSPLAEFVKVLNMASLVHQGSRSLTARLLGRTKNNLEEFVAPQTSFGMNCFPALSRCRKLRLLDLSLVSESPALHELFKATAHLEHLLTFRLPRSSGFGVNFDPAAISWPPNLETICLSGGIDAYFMHGVVAFPSTLRSLTVEHCPLASTSTVMHLLRTAVRPLPNLESLKLAYLPRLGPHSLDQVLYLLPGLRNLSVSVDYVTGYLFDFDHMNQKERFEADIISTTLGEDLPTSQSRHVHKPRQSQLRLLELTSSGTPGVEDKISPIDILIALDDGVLPDLRQIRVARSLMWESGAASRDVATLTDALQTLREQSLIRGEESAVAEDVITGVWAFDG